MPEPFAMRLTQKAKSRHLAGVASLCLLVALSTSSRLHAQSDAPAWERAAGSKQQFEVVSVRQDITEGESASNFPLDSGNTFFTIDKGYQVNPEGSLFSARNQTLLRYIVFAYKLAGTQELALRFDFYAGLGLHVPSFVRNSRYDIKARAPAAATKDQMRLMMQSLLAERFKLVVHWETREAPVFKLVVEKPGILGSQLELHRASDPCSAAALPEQGSEIATGRPSLAALPIPCGMIAHLPASAPGNHRFGGRDVSLKMMAESLATQTGLVVVPRPVIDQTGLMGRYDFWIEWTPEDISEVDNHESGGAFRQALKDQLGLKLQPAEGPVPLLVIDHMVQATPN